MSEEEKDLQLLEQALLKFGLASDTQFESLASSLLPPLIEKLSSPHQSVKTKVLKNFSHVNQRYNAEKSWKLPVSALLELLQSFEAKDMLASNFALCYLLVGLNRSSLEEKSRLLFSLMGSLSKLNFGCQQAVCSFFVQFLDGFKYSKFRSDRDLLFKFLLDPSCKTIFLSYCLDLLLYSPQFDKFAISPGHSIDSESAIKSTQLFGIQAQLPDSNSILQISQLTLESLVQKKIYLINMLWDNIDILSDEDIYIHALIASCDALSDVQQRGDSLIKKISKKPLEDKKTVTKLFELFLGEIPQKDQVSIKATKTSTTLIGNVNQRQDQAQQAAEQNPNIQFKSKRTPVFLTLRLKIVDLLSRSMLASNMFPFNVQLFFAGLFGQGNENNPKMAQLILGFNQWALRNSSDALMKAMGPIILSGLTKYMNILKKFDHGGNGDQTQHLYKASLDSLKIATHHNYSALAKRSPRLFSTSIDLFKDLMAQLRETDSVLIRSSIQETLTSLCVTYSEMDAENKKNMMKILYSNFEQSRTLLNDENMQIDEEHQTDSNQAYNTIAPPNTASKFISVFYANRVFSFSDAESRFLCLEAANDPNKQVAEEAQKGLEPFKVVDNEIVSIIIKKNDELEQQTDIESIEWPSFFKMAKLVFEKRNLRSQDSLSFPSETYRQILTFLHKVLKHHRSNLIQLIKIQEEKKTDFSSANQSSANPQAQFIFKTFCELLIECLVNSSSPELTYTASEILLEVVQYETIQKPEILSDSSSKQLNNDELFDIGLSSLSTIDVEMVAPVLSKSLLYGTIQHTTKKNIARVLGILTPHVSSSSRTATIAECMQIIKTRSNLKKEEQVGAMFGISQVLASILRKKLSIDTSIIESAVTEMLETIEITKLDKVMHHGLSNPLLIAACESIGNIAKWHSNLANLPSQSHIVESLSKTEESSKPYTLLDSILSLLASSDTQVVICASNTISNLCLGDFTLASRYPSIHESLMSTYRIKSEETHFSIGDALSIVAFGWHSNLSHDSVVLALHEEEEQKKLQSEREQLSIQSDQAQGSLESTEPESTMNLILTKLLKEYLLSARQDTRMPSCIWLLSLLKHCGSHPEIIRQLKLIQTGFIQLLSDSNEVIQEAAGKGLSLVYELGDETTKKELVDSLVNALQKGASTFKVTADSTIFQEGAVGTTPTGDKLTTYRELVNLASEMNQPDLIYKFMNLSAHNALWNSKKGAAFATGELAKKADAQIKSHLPNLIPKLYRSSYDPNIRIANSMKNILNTLVDDPKKALTQYFGQVATDLLENLWSPQWRNRESSCYALSDLVASREYQEIDKYLYELWHRCFKVLDDIKESVRKAAEALNKSLSNLTVRLCDPTYTDREHGKKALEIALPFLLEKGLLSDVKEVRQISLNMLLRLSKVSSFLLKPHIATLIPVLLKALSYMEPADLNYLEQHASRLGLSSDLLDSARIGISQSSPIFSTIDFCVQQVDTANITELAPKLTTLLATDNGIATRAGTSHVITQIALTRPEACRLQAHKLMVALKKGISSRTAQVRKAYGYAMGQVAKCAKPKTLETIVNGLIDSYANASPEDDDMRSAVAEALLELSKSSVSPATLAKKSMDIDEPTSSDSTKVVNKDNQIAQTEDKSHVERGSVAIPVLQPFYPVLIPIVFLGRFDQKEETAKVFNKIWEECGASLALYVPQIVESFAKALESPSWPMKQQGARAISSFSESLNVFKFQEHAPKLLDLLIHGLKGRTWTGKESLLQAMSKLVASIVEIWAHQFDQEAKNNTSQSSEEQKSAVQQSKESKESKESTKTQNASLKKIPSPEDILKILINECERKSLEYKKEAVVCLGSVLLTFAKHLPQFDSMTHVFDTLNEIASRKHIPETDETNSSSEKKSSEEVALSRSIRLGALQALASAFPSSFHLAKQERYIDPLIELFTSSIKNANLFSVKISCLNALKAIVPKIETKDWSNIVKQTTFDLLVNTILTCLVDPKYTAVRLAAGALLTDLVSQANETMLLEARLADIEKAIAEANQISSGGTPPVSDRLLQLLARQK